MTWQKQTAKPLTCGFIFLETEQSSPTRYGVWLGLQASCVKFKLVGDTLTCAKVAYARMLASQNIVIILCGNKKDLDADREVTFLEASRFAQENELMFLETSALTGENVEEAFVQCARKILNKIESGELDPERMGSGIQYGDAALRQLRSPRRAQAPSAQECGC